MSMLRGEHGSNGRKGYVSMAYRQLEAIPPDWAQRYAAVLTDLDLTHNKMTDLRSLAPLVNLRTLVLDHNGITTHAKLPPLPNLQTLWVNFNNISNTSVFISNLALSCPKLQHLSLMHNEGVPNMLTGATPQAYAEFRHSVLCCMPGLKSLDDTPVTPAEVQEALRIYGRIKPIA
eukprot:m.143310 g.143310  ORF g.143310 m.143310 type:complete len:175 (+) comp16737_c1_seq1:204-728(+)